MKILGIDPGLKNTGYGFIEYRGERANLIETGVIEPKPRDPLQNRVETIYRNLRELMELHKPQVLVLEKLYAHYKHPVTACIMGHARGVICLLCAQLKVRLEEYSVKKVRQAVVGNGNASKEQTRAMVGRFLRIDESKLSLDASDALALALGYTHFLRRKI